MGACQRRQPMISDPHLALVRGAPVDTVADFGSSGFNYTKLH